MAYFSLLTPRRQALHAAAGRALEALYADRLAYHYAQTEEAARAVDYLTHFAAQSAASYALEEAITAFLDLATVARAQGNAIATPHICTRLICCLRLCRLRHMSNALSSSPATMARG